MFKKYLVDIIAPVVIYFLVSRLAMILLSFLMIVLLQGAGENGNRLLVEQEATINGVIGGVATLIGILPLLSYFKQELSGSEADKSSVSLQTSKLSLWISVPLIILLAASSSLAVNILFAYLHITESSEAYNQVASRQYGVAFLLGLFLYGIISPFVEEVLFRGIVYNRLKRFVPVWAAICLSAVLFGLFHGNFVQGLYGGYMGILIAYIYERMQCFLFPCLFHATANILVYTLAQNMDLQAMIFKIPYAIIFFTISIVCILVIKKQ